MRLRRRRSAARRPDELAIYNERIRLLATATNAIALAIIGFGLLRPLMDDVPLRGWRTLFWLLVGLALHGLAHYILGMIEKEVDDGNL